MLGAISTTGSQAGESQSLLFSNPPLALLTFIICRLLKKRISRQKKKLSFLFLATGSMDKLSKIQVIADTRGDPMSRFHNTLYAGDVEGRITVLQDVGLCE